jgi:hypothetical protein
MTIRVSRRVPPANQARKAAAIARGGGFVRFAGDNRQARRIHDLLAGESGVAAFLGRGPDGSALLLVYPASGAGRDTDRVV